MVKGLIGYLYAENTVVMDKSDIRNASQEDFRPVRLFIDEKYIKQWAKELEMMTELEDQQESEW